jgi:hypothetical protein
MRDIKNYGKWACFVVLPCLVIKSPDFSEERVASVRKVNGLLPSTPGIISATLKMGTVSLSETLEYLTTPRCRYANGDHCGH